MEIRCIVIDDEPPARDELTYLLTRIDDVSVVAEASSAAQAIEAIEEHEPDLVFLDIEMPGGNGFVVVEAILDMEHQPMIIFATAFDQYAIRAFEENAIDYILKPVSEKRLAKGLDRVRNLLSTRDDDAASFPDSGGLTQLLSRISSASPFTRISVENNGRVMLLQPEEIIFCRAEDKTVWIHVRDDRFVAHGVASLSRLEEKLAPHGFFRSNRSDLVNLARVREFSPWFNGKYNLVMDDVYGSEIAVNKSRVKEFKERLGL